MPNVTELILNPGTYQALHTLQHILSLRILRLHDCEVISWATLYAWFETAYTLE